MAKRLDLQKNDFRMGPTLSDIALKKNVRMRNIATRGSKKHNREITDLITKIFTTLKATTNAQIERGGAIAYTTYN